MKLLLMESHISLAKAEDTEGRFQALLDRNELTLALG